MKYATVVLGNAESGEITRETGRDGRFTFLGVEPGTYSISGGAQGYIWQEYGARRPGGHGIRITMTEGEPAASINFRLTPHGGIAGRVTDEDGEPLTGVGIEALRYRFDSDTRRRELTPAGSDLRKPYDSARSRGRC